MTIADIRSFVLELWKAPILTMYYVSLELGWVYKHFQLFIMSRENEKGMMNDSKKHKF